MRKFTFGILIASFLIVIGGISAAQAQLKVGPVLRAEIPYNFAVGNRMFRAGEYTFERMPNSGQPASLLVMRGEGQSATFDTFPLNSTSGFPRTEVVLEYANGRYHLSGIKLEGQFTGYELYKTKMQRDAFARARDYRRVILTAG